jgi:hypothetical protein
LIFQVNLTNYYQIRHTAFLEKNLDPKVFDNMSYRDFQMLIDDWIKYNEKKKKEIAKKEKEEKQYQQKYKPPQYKPPQMPKWK